jgi:vacuolar-type H+-ATPase subunit I/STV1
MDNRLYIKGMQKISVQVPGFRNKKYCSYPRLAIISALLKSKKSDVFLNEFMNNIEDEIKVYSNSIEYKNILKTQDKNLINKDNYALLFFCLFKEDLDNKDKLLEYILSFKFLDTQNESDNIKIKKTDYSDENETEKLKQTNHDLEKQINELSEFSKNRKEKIENLKLQIQKKDKEILELKNNIKKLSQIEINYEILQKEYYEIKNKINEEENVKVINIAIVGAHEKNIYSELKNVKVYSSYEITDFFKDKNNYDNIYVNQNYIQVVYLRKLKKIIGVKFFDNDELILKEITGEA